MDVKEGSDGIDYCSRILQGGVRLIPAIASLVSWVFVADVVEVNEILTD